MALFERSKISKRSIFYSAAALGLISIDQLSKIILPSSFINREGSFSLSLSNRAALFLAMAFLLGMFMILRRKRQSLATSYQLLATLVIAGGISNLLDRLFLGGVRDVWTVENLYFNLADIYVVLGLLGFIVLLLYCFIVKRRRTLII